MAAELDKSLTAMDWLPNLGSAPGGSSGLSPRLGSSISINPNLTAGPVIENAAVSSAQADQAGNDTGQAETKAVWVDGNLVEKPPYSYANLITLAIQSQEQRKMTLSEIYSWITDNYPYYKGVGNGWKNSIRHNLSLNKSFIKLPRSRDDPGKGCYWAITSDWEANVAGLQTFTRAKRCEQYGDSQYLHDPNSGSYFPHGISTDSFGRLQPPVRRLPVHHVSPNGSYGLSSSGDDNLTSANSSISPRNQLGLRPLPTTAELLGAATNWSDLSSSFRCLYRSMFGDMPGAVIGSNDPNMGGQLAAGNSAGSLSFMETSWKLTPPSEHDLQQQQQSRGYGDLGQMEGGDTMNIEQLRESLRLAQSWNWAGFMSSLSGNAPSMEAVELRSQFHNLFESMRHAEANNWTLTPEQVVNLAGSLSALLSQANSLISVSSDSSTRGSLARKSSDQAEHQPQQAHQQQTQQNGGSTPVVPPLYFGDVMSPYDQVGSTILQVQATSQSPYSGEQQVARPPSSHQQQPNSGYLQPFQVHYVPQPQPVVVAASTQQQQKPPAAHRGGNRGGHAGTSDDFDDDFNWDKLL